MRHLTLILLRELLSLTGECVRWLLFGALYLASLWLLTAGLPRIVAIINGGAR